MKLKEKLAREYKPDAECLELLHVACLTRDAYLAGFDKAREMAAALWMKGERHAYEDFMALGEDEVEE